MRWTLLVDPAGHAGWHNMAVDQALLDLAAEEGRAFLRIYRWDPSCLSFGRHEPALRRYDRQAVERLGLQVVRRSTGGRAVWHADELTYAVAAPTESFGPLREAYRHIHETLVTALQSIGFDAALADAPSRGPGVDAGACFASPAGGEVILQGKKVVGSAQLREGGAFLQHGSVLLAGSQEQVSQITLGTAPPDGSVSLGTVRGAPVPFDELAAAVVASARHWSADWETASVDPPSVAAAASRHAEQFRSPAWTWRR